MFRNNIKSKRKKLTLVLLIISQSGCSKDLPVGNDILVAIYANNSAILAQYEDLREASVLLQNRFNRIEDCLKSWQIKANPSKLIQVTFNFDLVLALRFN